MTKVIAYDVPEQDLRVKLSRMRTLPQSGFLIRNVRPKQPSRRAGRP